MSAVRIISEGCATGFAPAGTAEGELSVDVPQVREAAEPFVSKLFPRGLRTEPLKAMVIGAFVRGLWMRDVESLCEQAGLGKLFTSTASRICSELRERFEAFGRRDLYDIQVAALFLDAVFLCVRRDGPKEGVLVAWGFTEEGERVLLSVMLGMRESHEDWLTLGRDLISRGLGAPPLIVADGAPGQIKAAEQCWPASDRQHCAVHRVRNLWPSCPNASASASARPTGRPSTRPSTNATQSNACRPWSTSSTTPATRQMPRRRPRRDRRAPALPDQAPPTVEKHKSARAIPRRGQTTHQGDRPIPRRDQLPHARVGRA
jgi:transposase-like protein